MTKQQNNYAALEEAVARHHRPAVFAALDALTEHEKDLLVDCPVTKCRAAERKECVGTKKGVVHIGRRLKRLLEKIK